MKLIYGGKSYDTKKMQLIEELPEGRIVKDELGRVFKIVNAVGDIPAYIKPVSLWRNK